MDLLLRKCFGAAWASFERAEAADVEYPQSLVRFLAANPGVRAVSSHLLRPPPPPGGWPVMMLRHPIDRVRSIYQMSHRDPVQLDHHAATNFADYIRWKLDTPGQSVPVINHQVFHLSDATFRPGNAHADCTRDDLRQVCELIAGWPAIGLARRFAPSCRLFEAAYRPVFPELRLSQARENVSPWTCATEAAAIQATKAELGSALYRRLYEANLLDLELYAFATTLFEALLVRQGQPPKRWARWR